MSGRFGFGNTFGNSKVIDSGGGITPQGILYNRPTFRGDTTSYRTGDAGWLYASGYYDFTGDPTNPSTIAKISDFNTLDANNLFGNTNRFTDETGAVADGTNQFLLDHLTGMMFADDGIANVVWNDAIDNALASTLGGYTDWHLVTTEEMYSTLSYATALTSYMVTTGATGTFTSTTRPSSTGQAFIFVGTTAADNFSVTNKTNTRNAIYCRAFYWNDTF